MKFTKLLSLAIALLLIALALFACGGGNDTTAPDTTKAPDAPDTTEVPETTEAPGTTAHVHSHKLKSSATVKPTCTEAGSKTYACECGDSYTEPTEALGHKYRSGKDTTDAYMRYVCSVCDDTYYTAVGSEAKLDKLPDGIFFIDYIANVTFTGDFLDVNSSLGAKKSNSDAYQYITKDEATGNDYWTIQYTGTDAWWDFNTTNNISAKYIISMDVQYTGGAVEAHLFKLRAQNAAGTALFNTLLVLDVDANLCYYDYKAEPIVDEAGGTSYPLTKIEGATLSATEWKNVAIIVDEHAGTFDAYLDGKLIKAGIAMEHTYANTDNPWPGMNVNSGRVRMAQISNEKLAEGSTLVVMNLDNAKLCNYAKGILD